MLAKEWKYFDAFMEQCQTFLIHEMLFMSQEEFRELAGNSCVWCGLVEPSDDFNNSFTWDRCEFIGACFGIFVRVVRIRREDGVVERPMRVAEAGIRYLEPNWIHFLQEAAYVRESQLPQDLGRIGLWWR